MGCVRVERQWGPYGVHGHPGAKRVLATQKAEEGAQALNSDTPPPGITDKKRILDGNSHPLAASVD